MKKIVIIRNAASYDFGGGERFPVFLAEILKAKELEPVIVSRSKKLLDFAKERDIKTVRGWWWSKQQWSGVNIFLTPLYFVWQLFLFFYYLTLFMRLQPTAIHIQSKDDFIAATFAGRLLGKSIVWTDHADLKHVWKNLDVWYKNPIGKVVYLAAKYAHAITVVSKSEEQLVTSNLPSASSVRNKIQVVYNGVVDQADQFDTTKNDAFTYIVASRLVTDKGINEVIDAFEKLNKSHPNTQLLLLGDGPEAKDFKKKASDTPSIVFQGHTSSPLEYITKANVFVHPTYHEGFSVALVEASMLGLPIIATSVGGNVEIINNKNTGILVPSKNTDELFNAMEKLLEDETLRITLGKNARKQYIEKFQFNTIVANQFIPLYGVTK